MANERKLADKKGKGKGTKEAGEGLLWSPYKYLLDQDGWDFKPLYSTHYAQFIGLTGSDPSSIKWE